MDTSPLIRLATYGTLAPGRANASQLEALHGTWTSGTVRGHLVDRGWGASHGFPALVLDSTGETVDVELFESHDLPQHWERLDEFEGDEYRRTRVEVALDARTVPAYIYIDAIGTTS